MKLRFNRYTTPEKESNFNKRISHKAGTVKVKSIEDIFSKDIIEKKNLNKL